MIWVKGASSYTPDYYVERLPTSPWIHQPFEDYDNMGPDRLAALNSGRLQWGQIAVARQNPGWRRSFVPRRVA